MSIGIFTAIMKSSHRIVWTKWKIYDYVDIKHIDHAYIIHTWLRQTGDKVLQGTSGVCLCHCGGSEPWTLAKIGHTLSVGCRITPPEDGGTNAGGEGVREDMGRSGGLVNGGLGGGCCWNSEQKCNLLLDVGHKTMNHFFFLRKAMKQIWK